MIAYAAAADVAKSFVDQINEVIVFPLIVLMSAVALLMFIWGGFQYVYGAADSGARETGRRHLIWGVIGLLVMVSAYAILEIAANTFKIDIEDSSSGTISGGAEFGAYRPTDSPRSFPGKDADDVSAASPSAPVATLEEREDEIKAEMAAAGVDSEMQRMRWVAMTVGTPGNRLEAVSAAFDLGYFSEETKLFLLKQI